MAKRCRIRRRAESFEKTGVFTVVPEEFEDPLAWSGAFGRDVSLNIEIGFGKGEFLMALASGAPENDFVGIELDAVRLAWTEVKLYRAGISNVRLVQGDADLLLDSMFACDQVDAVYMNFPDPWPKTRHARRRLIRASVLDSIIRVVKPGGLMTVVTDVGSYAKAGLKILEARRDVIENVFGPEGMADEIEGYPETVHEMKFRAAGRSMHFMRYKKK